MDKKLEQYLQTVESELEGLREQQRESELREMRQHLEAIVARLTEGGLSREEAIDAALAQFGAARSVGRELDTAVASREPWWRTLLAPACALAFQIALSYPFSAAIAYVHGPAPLVIGSTASARAFALTAILYWLTVLSSSAIAGYISPRWGGRILLCLMSARTLVQLALPTFPPDNFWQSVLVTLEWRLVDSVWILVGAYLGSRLAQKHRNTQTPSPTEIA